MKRLILLVSFLAIVNCTKKDCDQETPFIGINDISEDKVYLVLECNEFNMLCLYGNDELIECFYDSVSEYITNITPGDTIEYYLKNYGSCKTSESNHVIAKNPKIGKYIASWDRNKESDLAGYWLFLNDSLIYTGIDTMFHFETFDSVCCYLFAFDSAGNISEKSETVCLMRD